MIKEQLGLLTDCRKLYILMLISKDAQVQLRSSSRMINPGTYSQTLQSVQTVSHELDAKKVAIFLDPTQQPRPSRLHFAAL